MEIIFQRIVLLVIQISNVSEPVVCHVTRLCGMLNELVISHSLLYFIAMILNGNMTESHYRETNIQNFLVL